eukprot:jgi/Tetstr1/466180/TSEL_010740.t1
MACGSKGEVTPGRTGGVALRWAAAVVNALLWVVQLLGAGLLLLVDLATGLAGWRQGSARPRFMVHKAWEDALFLHWAVPPEQLQALLPLGLEPDLLDGKAYIGLVLLREAGIQPALAPRLRSHLGITHLAANVRTYVRPRGKPSAPGGVYFFSLEASSFVASLGAFTLFGLPYHAASMERTWDTVRRQCRFTSTRWGWTGPPLEALYEAGSTPEVGSDDRAAEFFVERYCLYHRLPFRRRVSRGRICHLPWKLRGGCRLLHLAGASDLIASVCPGLQPVAAANHCAHDLAEQMPLMKSTMGEWGQTPAFVHFGSVDSNIEFHMFEPVL